jgi:hypothetical protein
MVRSRALRGVSNHAMPLCSNDLALPPPGE